MLSRSQSQAGTGKKIAVMSNESRDNRLDRAKIVRQTLLTTKSALNS
jgi:hypothetical protein